MSLKLAIGGVLMTAVVAAAAAGGYLALRHNATDLRSAAATAMTESTSAVDAPTPAPGPTPSEPSEAAATPSVTTREAIARVPAPRPAVAAAPESPATPAAQPAVPPSVAPVPVLDVAQISASAPVNSPSFPSPVELSQPPAEELTVERDAVIGIRLDSTISSETARVEDRVNARVIRDVMVDGRTAVSAGTRLEGVVASVDRGGRFKERARIGVRFHSLMLADNTRLPIETETIFRESESPARDATAKVGASAAVGGILGALIGGKKGAAIGSTMGAAGGAAAVMKGGPADVVLPAGAPLTVRLTAPITLSIPRQD